MKKIIPIVGAVASGIAGYIIGMEKYKPKISADFDKVLLDDKPAGSKIIDGTTAKVKAVIRNTGKLGIVFKCRGEAIKPDGSKVSLGNVEAPVDSGKTAMIMFNSIKFDMDGTWKARLSIYDPIKISKEVVIAIVVEPVIIDLTRFHNMANSRYPVWGKSATDLYLFFPNNSSPPYSCPDGSRRFIGLTEISGNYSKIIIRYKALHTIWYGWSFQEACVWYADGTFEKKGMHAGSYRHYREYTLAFPLKKPIAKIGFAGAAKGGTIQMHVHSIKLIPS